METRSQAKARKGRGDGETPGAPKTSSLVSSSSRSSATILAQKLALQAAHVRKIAEADRAEAAAAAAAKAAAASAASEREAANLELQAQFAALEAENGESRRSRRSVASSMARVNQWLVTSENTIKEPIIVVDPVYDRFEDAGECRQDHALCGGRSPLGPHPTPTTANIPALNLGLQQNANVCGGRSPAEPNPPTTTANVQVPTYSRQYEANTCGGRSPSRPQLPPTTPIVPFSTGCDHQNNNACGGSRPLGPYPTTATMNVPTYAHNPQFITNSTKETQQRDNDIALLAQVVRQAESKPRVGDGRLPIFDGKTLDWLAFKRVFEDTQASFSASDNLARLSLSLRGAAREAVAVLLVSARDPAEVIKSLNRRFGRSEHIVLQEVAAVRSLPRLMSEHCGDLNKFTSKVSNAVETMRLLEQTSYLDSPELYQSILSKLTPLQRSRWSDFGMEHLSQHGKTKLELLVLFLEREVEKQLKFGLITDSLIVPKRYEKVHAVATVDSSHNFSKPSSSTISAKIHKQEISPEIKFEIKLCIMCQLKHNLSKCDKFVSLSVSDRWEFVKENKLCHKCLKKGSHSYKFCKNNKEVCNVPDCKFRHHRLLHDAILVAHTTLENELECSNATTSSESQVGAPDKQSCEVIAHTTSLSKLTDKNHNHLRPFLKILAVTISGPLGSVETFALLDDGATATFIDSQLCEQIGVAGPESHVRLDCVGGLGKEVKVQYVDFHIKGAHALETFTVRKARAIDNLGLSKQTIRTENIQQFAHLEDLAHVLCYDEAVPKIIIGIDNWHLTISKSTRKGSRSQPVAINTELGWVLFGFESSRTKAVDVINHINISSSHDDHLNSLIQDYYKLDSLGITKKECRSEDDKKAIKILENTTRHLPDGAFEIGLPWKDEQFKAPDSYGLALSRFKSLERKMAKEPAYAELYRVNMQATIDKNYAEGPVSSQSSNLKCWYLPHFGVTNPNKPGKLRIVHDASAKSNDVSLNTMLLTGPDLLNSIIDILFRFREGKVGLSGDIREMFPQVKIREADRDAQRFLWRKSPEEPIQIYRMGSMMFGAASSPFSAQYIKNLNATEHQSLFPEAAEAIIRDHYMDDCIVSVDSAAKAARLAADIVHVHQKAHYEMRSWVSNDPAALALIPKDLLLDPSLADVNVDLGKVAKSVRTLGLVWQPVNDCLSFDVKSLVVKSISDRFTKREALSLLMCVYDPLGFLAPLVVRARIMFQNVWRKAVDWDQQLSQDDSSAWKEWHTACLNSISNLEIPRRYNLTELDITQRELHVLCDASESAYACVAYWRLLFPDHSIAVVLIGSKVRVAPLRPATIARLELQGALVAARFADTICKAHTLKPDKRVFWCDSMNVLGWLRNDARNFKPFVANRVGEILELTSVSEWRWVPTEANVADDATRLGKDPLTMESRWFSGPKFLLSAETQWPAEPVVTIPAANAELKSRHKIIDKCHAISDEPSHHLAPIAASPLRVSRWLCLVRATALVHLFARKLINICRSVGNPRLTLIDLTVIDLQLAETHILWQSQLDSFETEIACLQRNTSLPRSSRLLNLSPIIGEDKLLRLSGRITAVTGITAQAKSPIILDGKHPAVRLLVLRYHQKAAHANTETVVNELRQTYWIIHLRSTVRSVANNCLFCRQRKATPYNPPMGQLPPARLAHSERPFSFTGLDYFGPVNVTIGRRHEKRYVALYTCLVTRAVHLEVVHSLSTDAAVMSLRRFVARRGCPRQMYSDNGTAFVGLNRELKKLYGDQIASFAVNEKIEWKFIPPAAPFMGGAWERLVRSIKTALKVTLKEKSPSDEVLGTLLVEAEALVNSRPLTHVSPDPDYPEALTPSHFLIGTSSGRNIPVNSSERDLIGRVSWRKAVRMADQFWRRWVVEYLPQLNPSRGAGQPPIIKEGDVVIIADNNMPRGLWPKGKIVQIYRGRDGIARVADVTTSAGLFKRPLKKLIPIMQ